MKVEILQSTPYAATLAGIAAATCTRSYKIDKALTHAMTS